MTAYDLYPDDESKVFIQLLSVLILPIKRQFRIIGIDKNATNGETFLYCIAAYYPLWKQACEQEYPSAEALYEEINSIPRPVSQQSFLHDEEWQKLRTLAKQALHESTIPPLPVPRELDYTRYTQLLRL